MAVGASCSRDQLKKQSYADSATMKGTQFSQDGLQRFHKAMASYVTVGERPGLVTLLSKNGETHADAIGTSEFSGGAVMQRSTIFRIASITKPLTGAVTMRLIEQGKLALDEPVERLIPELANRRVLKRLNGPLDDTVSAKRPILVSDLLTMRMGMGAIMSQGDYPIQTELMKTGVFTPFKMPVASSADAWIATPVRFWQRVSGGKWVIPYPSAP